MKFRIHFCSVASVIICASLMNGFSQGSLTPPASITPSMKTLSQIEPRTAISSGGYTITAPGSYYLTTNITVNSGYGIIISTNNVKLDLCGFMLASTANPASADAILLSTSLTNVMIVNGVIYSGVTNNGALVYGGNGWGGAINGVGTQCNVRVEGVQVSGCITRGILLGMGAPSIVKNCQVNNVGGIGIQADYVLNCTVDAAGYGGTYGIQAGTVCNTRCTSYAGTAISAAQIADNSQGASTSGAGMVTVIASNCRGSSSGSIGLDATIVNNCEGDSVSSSGIFTSVGRNSYALTQSATSSAFYANFLATGCYGNGAAGIYSAKSLVSCAGTVTSATYKFNMP